MPISAKASIPNAPDIDRALADARAVYAASRPNSLNAFERSQIYMPGGNTRTVLYHGPFPLRVESGYGARIRDVDGLEYLNLLGEFTAGIFGHTHPVVQQAIRDALENGINLSAHTSAEIEFAQLLQGRFPSMRLLRFTNSGTEANLMAVTAARIATNREMVMVFGGGYHGGVFYFGGGGSPVNAPFPYLVSKYNDIEAARMDIRENAGSIACVLVEPMIGSGGCIPAIPGFLEMLREETQASGAALIFDEVMTSRFSTGGAQQLDGVRPDLTTLGKYLGGGLSFGAFGGDERYMAIFDPSAHGAIPHAGTFNNNALTMAAGRAVLREVLTDQALRELNSRGDDLRRRLNETFSSAGVALSATGRGSLMSIHPASTPPRSPTDAAALDDRFKELLFLELLERGYYMARRCFIALSLAVSESELSDFIRNVDDVVEKHAAILSAA